eukprot:scaffold190553_cov33-Tisochrysis_lutea.AAC.2
MLLHKHCTHALAQAALSAKKESRSAAWRVPHGEVPRGIEASAARSLHPQSTVWTNGRRYAPRPSSQLPMAFGTPGLQD